MNGYDSVFANAKDEELEFETMFDQEDDLIDTIVGCNENGDPLTGADPCPAATAEDRSSSDENPDYEKDINAPDSKDVPKNAEGTTDYDFEEEPKVDDNTEVKDQSKSEEEYTETKDSDKGVEDTVTGTIENEDDVLESYFKEAEASDENPDYEKDIDAPDSKDVPKNVEGTVKNKNIEEEAEIDFEFDQTIPKDVEGTVGYDFEVNPEIGVRDDQSTVDPKDVKVEEEVEIDYEDIAPEGTEKTLKVDPTEVSADCGDGTCGTDVTYDFEEAAEVPDEVKKIDKDVEDIEDIEGYIDDDAIEDAETKDPDPNLDYDISDEEVIDYVINNK